MKNLFILVLVMTIPIAIVAQDECDYQPSEKVSKLLEKSEDKKKYDSEKRYNFLVDALEEDDQCLPCLLNLAESSFKRAKRAGAGFGESESYLERITERCQNYHSDVWYYLGAIHYANQRYTAALNAFDHFIHFPDEDPTRMSKDYEKKYEEVEGALPYVSFYNDYFRHGSELKAIIVKGVSSEKDDYLPALAPDGELMFYTRTYMKKAKGDLVSRSVEEFTWSRRVDINGEFDEGEALTEPFNMGDNYGGASISVDNRELFIAKKNPVPGNPENIDIYSARYQFIFDQREGKKVYKWSPLENLGPSVNTDNGWESQPSLSGDGKTLYFATVRENTIPDNNGNPSTDIWYSVRQEDGSWSEAKPLEGDVNTPFHDKAPFMHSDSHTMYFASDRKPGGGGYDIWYTRQENDGRWSASRNIGTPINSEEDEHGMIVSADGEEAYFASRRLRGSRGLDIYSFALPEDARPEKVIILKGKVEDENGEVPEGASVELKYVQSEEVTLVEVNQDDGGYATVVNVDRGEDVVVTVQAENTAFNSHLVVDKEEATQPAIVKLEVKTETVSKSKPFLIPDIFYATNSADIDRTSKLILDEFAAYLMANSSIYVEIGGHTDDQGGDAANLALSMDRAFEVKGYLESKGIAGKRITAKGYGETKPVADNTTPEGRSKNRRTEFTILRL